MSQNPYGGREQGLSAPPGHAEAVTPSDTVDLDFEARGLYVGGAGDVKVVMLSGAAVTFKSVPVGTTLAVRFTRVDATGTTATQLVALF
jgi:hypothetical protein